MIVPYCIWCGSELTSSGGLLFGPPDAEAMVRKYHLCRKCFQDILDYIEA